jgi:Flp pilus assembly protein TadD
VPTRKPKAAFACSRTQAGFAEGHNDLGALYQRGGRLEDATLHYRRALELNPRFRQPE